MSTYNAAQLLAAGIPPSLIASLLAGQAAPATAAPVATPLVAKNRKPVPLDPAKRKAAATATAYDPNRERAPKSACLVTVPAGVSRFGNAFGAFVALQTSNNASGKGHSGSRLDLMDVRAVVAWLKTPEGETFLKSGQVFPAADPTA
jgi:hypothetical protein